MGGPPRPLRGSRRRSPVALAWRLTQASEQEPWIDAGSVRRKAAEGGIIHAEGVRGWFHNIRGGRAQEWSGGEAIRLGMV